MTGGSGSLTGLGSFVGINRAEFAIDVGELAFQFVLLVENLLAFSMKALAVTGNKISESPLSHRVLPHFE